MKKEKVEATFKFGFGTSQRLICVLISYMIFVVLAMTAFIVVFVLDHDYELLAASIVFCLMILMFIAVVLAEKIKLKKEIEKWMQDAIEYDVLCTCAGKVSKASAISVKFEYNGKTIIKVSNGLSRFFTKYVDKQIKILYSPKYDEVMILSINK